MEPSDRKNMSRKPNMGRQLWYNVGTQIYTEKSATGHEIANLGTK